VNAVGITTLRNTVCCTTAAQGPQATRSVLYTGLVVEALASVWRKVQGVKYPQGGTRALRKGCGMTFSRMTAIPGAVLICLCAAAVHAEPISYLMTFTVTTGSPAPPPATFSYDSAKPLNSRFSNFIVTWAGQSYDLTSAANSPSFQGSVASNLAASCFRTLDSAGVFFALTYIHGCPGLIGNIWQANANVTVGCPGPDRCGTSEFRLLLTDVGLNGWAPEVEGVGTGGAQTPTVEGNFTVTLNPNSQPAPTPLPNSVIFALTGIVGLSLWKLQRRMKMRSAGR